MNDVNKRKEMDFGGNELSGNTSQASEEIFYKKLGAYLLLLYQAYLKIETRLEPETKAALLRMVQFDQDYAAKIRMMQLDQLNKEFPMLDVVWDEAKDILFPIEESQMLAPVSDARKKTIVAYKAAVSTLLRTSA